MDLPETDNYRSLLLNQTPMLDVRAPVEFLQGAFPFTKNVPLINDKEREAIGICYKKAGQDEAIKLGNDLVKGEIRQARIKHWQEFIEKNPNGVLYCFRGGMRSKISQQWIYEQTGIIYPRIKGGYKAMRRYLIDELTASAKELQPVMLGGRTGIGKTLLLKEIKQQVDLENIFHHRGSVFGKHATPQPSQINIENTLSIELLKHRDNQHTHIVLEDEGTNIGSRSIPEVLHKKMRQSPLIVLEASVDERVEITFQEYIVEALLEHQALYGEVSGFDSWANQLQAAIDKIQRRLGGERYKQIKVLLSNAINRHQTSGRTDDHKAWIKTLLVDYYDPMYDFQTAKKRDRMVLTAKHDEVLAYLKEYYNIV